MPNMMTLRTMRRAADLSQQYVADHLGVNRATVSKWERGTVSLPVPLIPVLAELYGVARDDVTGAALASCGIVNRK